MQNTTPKKEYDIAMKGKAFAGLALRVVVAAYIVYLAWKILSGFLNGSSPIPVWGIWLICIAFAAVAVGFCFFAWKAFRKALKAAEYTSDQDIKCSASGEDGNAEEAEV